MIYIYIYIYMDLPREPVPQGAGGSRGSEGERGLFGRPGAGSRLAFEQTQYNKFNQVINWLIY